MNFLQRIAYQDFFSQGYLSDPSHISFVVNSNYKTSTFFVLDNRDANPAGVLRISNTRQFVSKEFVILQYLHKHGNDVIKKSVPKPIALHQCGNRYIASQSYVRAAKLKPPSWFEFNKEDRVKEHLAALRRWLLSLWQIPVVDIREQQVQGIDIFTELEYCFAKCDRENERFYRRMLAIVEDLKDSNLPLVINHNDLCLDNIFFDQGAPKVIDWELSYLTYPVFDWFYFTANYAQRLWSGRAMSMKSIVNSVKRAFFEDNWFSELLKNQTGKIYAEMNLDLSLMPLFYCLGMFDFLYRRHFPKLIDLTSCVPLFRLENLCLAQ